MSIFEELASTWEKRFMQRHYSYRDSHNSPTVVLTADQALGLMAQTSAAVLYTFGTNARTWTTAIPALAAAGIGGSRFAWPNMGDCASPNVCPRGQCYARNVMVYVTEDTWIRFISLNPIYGTLIAQGYTAAQIAAMGVTQTITEVEQFIGAGSLVTFYPTYGIAIVFRADTVAGMIYISVEGNVEGGE